MEKRQHKKPEAIWLFDYTSLAMMDDCPHYQVWLSERDINIIWQAVVNIDRFRSRVFTDVSGTTYTIADLDQFGNFKEWVSDMNVHMGEFMACNELLSQQNQILELLAEQLSRLADCSCLSANTTANGTGGSRGSGTTARPPINYNEGETPDTPPPGFSSWASYRTHKCNMSADILNGIIADLQSIAILDLVGITVSIFATTLIAVLITPIPFDDLLALASSIIVGAVSASYLLSVSTLLDTTYRTDFICALYNATDPSDAYAEAIVVIDEAVDNDSNIPSLVKPFVKDMLYKFVNPDSANRLFSNVPTLVTGTDCSSCGPAYWWECSVGETLEWTADTVEIGAIEGVYGEYVCILQTTALDDITTTLNNGSITPPTTAAVFCVTTTFDYDVGCNPTCFQEYTFQSDTGVFGLFSGIRAIMYRSGTPFSVIFEV